MAGDIHTGFGHHFDSMGIKAVGLNPGGKNRKKIRF